MNGPDCLEAQQCRGDFYATLETAIRQCGGNPAIVHGDPIGNALIERLGGEARPALVDMPLRDVVNLLAQNGIRMVYLPEKHIEPAIAP